ncbi:hypothetical protein E1264_18470 [Actinomadura sp. KC216]|uniref:hypothetical protein n=1 Tax=Actinomadura sp. KC216 TaxID=2530370 RepID=UPI0010504048|nr:hypothetical protein [Actinomadura sp. KC216]TDB86280.1 hypothetical protein E1264_18470 [Actinomadura sp. KC216]
MQYSTLPTAPGALLGYRKNGQPIHLIAGGDETGQQGQGDAAQNSPGNGQDTQNGGQAPPDTGTTQTAGTGQQAPAEGDVSSLPEWAQKALRDARADAGKSRTTAKQKAADEARQDLAQQIGKALGLVKDGDDAPDPAKLAEQLTGAQEEGRQARVELAVYKAAGKNGGDPEALLDSRAFVKQLADIDPTDGKKVAELIKKAVESNPNLAARTAPRAGGTDMGGGAPPPARQRPSSLHGAIKGALGS